MANKTSKMWKYRVFDIKMSEEAEDEVLTEFNDLGEDGWELVSVIVRPQQAFHPLIATAFFKKEVR